MEKIPFSKKDQRQISDFVAHELLYDYSAQLLDPERKEAVQQAIAKNPALAKELDDVLYGLSYCNHLSLTRAKPTIIQKIKQPYSVWRTIEKYSNTRTWPTGLQWAGEAFFISVTLLMISFFVPWESLIFGFLAKKNEQVLLSQMNRQIVPDAATPGDKGLNAEFKPSIDRTYTLLVANPQFTYNKLPTILTKFGAQITDQTLVPKNQDTLPQITLSIPQDRAEALIKELEAHGKLTLSSSSGENEKEKGIWTFLITLEKEVKSTNTE